MEGHNGLLCPIWWKGVSMIHGFGTPCLVSLSTSSLPQMFVCAFTFFQ